VLEIRNYSGIPVQRVWLRSPATNEGAREINLATDGLENGAVATYSLPAPGVYRVQAQVDTCTTGHSTPTLRSAERHTWTIRAGAFPACGGTRFHLEDLIHEERCPTEGQVVHACP